MFTGRVEVGVVVVGVLVLVVAPPEKDVDQSLFHTLFIVETLLIILTNKVTRNCTPVN